MRIIQIVPSISYGDGVSNDCIAIKRALIERGYETQIYAESISPKVESETALLLDKMPPFQDEDIVILHLASGHHLNFDLAKMNGKKVIRYHNITPPHFFAGYDRNSQYACSFGYEGVRYLADKVDYVIAVSEYNKQDLRRMGYTCDVDVMPILIPFDDYKQKPDENTIQEYSDGKTNVVFTGRVVPNKKQEDVIRAFHLYKKHYDQEARLFLVGSYKGMEKYCERLQGYVQKLGTQDVCFTGHIPFDQILAYYTLADVFVCMSEHEGFCIPLLEAMYFQTPILAYESSAIAGTLGGTGVLLPEKDPALAAGWMNRLVKDEMLREDVIEKQNRHLEDFTYETIKNKLYECMDKVIGEN